MQNERPFVDIIRASCTHADEDAPDDVNCERSVETVGILIEQIEARPGLPKAEAEDGKLEKTRDLFSEMTNRAKKEDGLTPENTWKRCWMGCPLIAMFVVLVFFGMPLSAMPTMTCRITRMKSTRPVRRWPSLKLAGDDGSVKITPLLHAGRSASRRECSPHGSAY